MKNSKLRRVLLLLACAVMLVSLSVGATLAYLSSTDSVKNTFTVGQVNITLDEGEVHPVGKIINDKYVAGTHTDEGATRVEENAYKVYPGMTYDKDPIVHVQGDSEDCYVGIAITLKEESLEALFAQIGYTETNGKQYLGLHELVGGGIFDTTKGTIYAPYFSGDYMLMNGDYNGYSIKLIQEAGTGKFYVIYQNKLEPTWTDADNDGEWDAGEGQINLDLFKTISVPADWDNDELAALQGLEMTITAYAVQAEGFSGAEHALSEGFENPFGFAGNLSN